MKNESFRNFTAVNGFCFKKAKNESDQCYITSNGIILIRSLDNYDLVLMYLDLMSSDPQYAVY